MKETLSQVYDYLRHSRETEIRIITDEGSAISKHVSTKDDFVKVCEQWDGRAHVYVGINERYADGTKDQDVISVQTIVLDLDPVRQAGTSATDEQIEAARYQAEKIADWSIENGWLRPELVMSGNGIHLYYAIPPIQITDENRSEVTIKLKLFETKIRDRFNNHFVKVDSIQNLSRVIKVPGTLSIKGDTHRRSHILGDMIRREDGALLEFLVNQEMPVETQSMGQIPLNGEVRQELCNAWNSIWLNGTQHSDRSEVLLLLATQLLSCGHGKEEVIQMLIDFDERNGSKFSKRRNREVQIERFIVDPAIRNYSLNPVSCTATDRLAGKGHCMGCTRDRIQAPTKMKWRRVVRELPQDSAVKSIEQVRSEIRRQIMEHEDGVLLIGSPPGSGKSTVAASTLREKNCRVLYLTHRHDLYDDIIQNLGAVPIKGRCSENCSKYVQASDIGRQGWSVAEMLCGRCEMAKNCGYYAQFKNNHSWVAPVQYLDSPYICDQSLTY